MKPSLFYQHLYVCARPGEDECTGFLRFAEMAVRVPEVMQVPRSAGHLDAVRMGQDLCAFHLAIHVYSSETEQTFTAQFIFCLWV